MRSSLTRAAAERWFPEIKLIYENDTVVIDCKRADSKAHLLRDAIRACRLHNIEPYHELYGKVVVSLKSENQLQITRKTMIEHAGIAVASLKRRNPVTIQEGKELIEAFVASPGKTLHFEICPAEELESHIEETYPTLLTKVDGPQLVIFKPDDFGVIENEEQPNGG